jgi:hypothetical protein
VNTREIVDNVKLLLDHRVSVDEFGDWMLVNTENLIRQGEVDDATRNLAYAIQLKMTEFDVGNINEENLRRELATTIQPYGSSR